MRRPASANVSRGPLGASVPTACRASGASLSADRAIVTATAITATLRLETVRAAETSPQDPTVRGRMKHNSEKSPLLRVVPYGPPSLFPVSDLCYLMNEQRLKRKYTDNKQNPFKVLQEILQKS